MPIRHVKGDNAARARFDAASIGSQVDRDVIHIAGYEPTDESPKFTGQNIGLAVHRADNVTRLHGYPFDFVRVNHFCSVLIIRKSWEFVSVILKNRWLSSPATLTPYS
jgi:hypothetical protein